MTSIIGGGGGGGGGLGGIVGNVVGAASGVINGLLGGGGQGLLGGLIGGGEGGLLGGVVGPNGIIGTILGVVSNLVGGIFQAGMGIVNTVLGFGGLGSAKATLLDVGPAIGINLGLDDGLYGNPEDYNYEIEQGIQRPQSGGMGGLLSLDLSLEDDEKNQALIQVGRKRREAGEETTTPKVIWDDKWAFPEQDPSDNDTVKAEKIGRGLLTLNLVKLISGQMGENLGKEVQKTGLIDRIGWKTLDEGGAEGNTLTHEDDAFVGFGSCEYIKVKKEHFERARTSNDLLKLLTRALRTQCVKKDYGFLKDLVRQKILIFNKDKTFDVSEDHDLLKSDKLSPEERSQLARAFELSIFSKAFVNELFENEPHSAPDNSPTTRRVHTFGEFVLNGIELASSDKFRIHEIKILRSLLSTIKAAFTKLVQDFKITRECSECTEELDVNKRDQIYLMGLMEFILHGLAPLHGKEDASVRDEFKAFDEMNAEVIENRVDNYLIQ